MRKLYWILLSLNLFSTPFAGICAHASEVAPESGTPESGPSDPMTESLKDKTEIHRITVGINANFTEVKSPLGGTKPLVGTAVQGQYAFSERLGVDLSLSETFTTSSFSNFWTGLSFFGVWAISGSLLKTDREIKLGSDSVVQSIQPNSGGFRLLFGVSDYLLNGSSSVVPFTGVGAGVRFDFPSHSRSNFFVGVRGDSVTNGKETLSPVQVAGGILICL